MAVAAISSIPVRSSVSQRAVVPNAHQAFGQSFTLHSTHFLAPPAPEDSRGRRTIFPWNKNKQPTLDLSHLSLPTGSKVLCNPNSDTKELLVMLPDVVGGNPLPMAQIWQSLCTVAEAAMSKNNIKTPNPKASSSPSVQQIQFLIAQALHRGVNDIFLEPASYDQFSKSPNTNYFAAVA